MEMMEMNISQFARTPFKSLQQYIRYTRNAGKMNMITAPDTLHSLTGRYEMKAAHFFLLSLSR